MRIDYARARQVFEIMLARYRAREYPYERIETDLPQYRLTEKIKRKPDLHARFLLLLCLYMRGTVPSNYAARRLVELFHETPALFDERVLRSNGWDIACHVRRKISWRHDQIGRFWYQNMCHLYDRWDGDPRTIFAGVTDREVLYDRIAGRNGYPGFAGHGLKMTSMLSYFLADAGLIEPNELSAPVDIHHCWMYLQTRMIVLPDGLDRIRYEKFEQIGIELAERLQREYELTAVEYGDVIWLWSLRACAKAPLTTSRPVRVPGKRMEVRIPAEIDWSQDRNVAWHERTCGVCALRQLCTLAVPAGVYSTTGILQTRERTEPSDRFLIPVLHSQRVRKPDAKQAKVLAAGERRAAWRRRPIKGLPLETPVQKGLFDDD